MSQPTYSKLHTSAGAIYVPLRMSATVLCSKLDMMGVSSWGPFLGIAYVMDHDVFSCTQIIRRLCVSIENNSGLPYMCELAQFILANRRGPECACCRARRELLYISSPLQPTIRRGAFWQRARGVDSISIEMGLIVAVGQVSIASDRCKSSWRLAMLRPGMEPGRP